MTWWGWAIMGLVLFAIEATGLGGLFLVFFGFGALSVSLLTYLGIATQPGVEWIIFALVSFASMFLFRSHIVKTDSHTPPEKDFDRDSLIGVSATVTHEIAAGEEGKVSIRGATWSAVNRGQESLSHGTRCVVVDINGLTVGIKKEE